MRYFLKIFSLLFFCGNCFSQDSSNFFAPASEFHKQRFVAVAAADVAGYGGSLALLSTAWYKDYNHTAFHTFNDSREWLQMDKAGHFNVCWYLGRMGIDMMEWSGADKKRSIWYGAAGGFLYMTGIELLDGFSDGWGFSWSDLSANSLGTGLIIGQKYLALRNSGSPVARGIRGMSVKFSFHQTTWPELRPELLGDSVLARQILKDYNGQSYWLSFNISSFLKTESKFPKWLNVSLGYGGEGMISGRGEYVTLENGNTLWAERYRQYYFSVDVDLTKIKTRSHILKTVFEALSFIKIPAPALQVDKNGLKFHPFYY